MIGCYDAVTIESEQIYIYIILTGHMILFAIIWAESTRSCDRYLAETKLFQWTLVIILYIVWEQAMIM